MIQSFADKRTETLWQRQSAKGFPTEIVKRALMRLQRLHAATGLEELRVPPSHRLEALRGDLVGCYSIRVNDQWRLVFRFEGGHAFEARLVDYH